ncbi:MAG TPA: acyl-CoA dehydrogenase family protein [Marmoricola sp.]|nr:acyl-CoA dehydrogenase family protein [Marmoricola sp.]
MDFNYDEDQLALADAIKSLITTDGANRWAGFADMGLLGLPFADSVGGMGAGPVEVSLVAEQMGRALAAEPYIEAVVLAGGLIDSCGTPAQREQLLGGLTDGSVVPIFTGLEPGQRWSFNAGGVTARREGDSWRLTGVKEPVIDADQATVFVVSALFDDEHVGLFLVDREVATVSSYATFDGGQAGRVVFDDTPAQVLGDAVDRCPEISHQVAAAQIAYCHEALGCMEEALRLTTSYLKTRKQFGVTLNRFQALTFRAADMYTSLELTRSIVMWATMVLAAATDDAAEHDVIEAAARAKLQCSRAGRHIGQEAIQLHGGIGMTDEYAVGHYTARLTALDHLLGDGRAQSAKLVETLTSHTTVDALR